VILFVGNSYCIQYYNNNNNNVWFEANRPKLSNSIDDGADCVVMLGRGDEPSTVLILDLFKKSNKISFFYCVVVSKSLEEVHNTVNLVDPIVEIRYLTTPFASCSSLFSLYKDCCCYRCFPKSDNNHLFDELID
jgi:hypothetical protein